MVALSGHDILAYDKNPTNQHQGMQHQHAAQHAPSYHMRASERPEPSSHQYLPISFNSAPRTSGPGSTSPTSRQLPLRQSEYHPTPSRGSDAADELSQKFESYASRDAYSRTQQLAASSDRARVDARAHPSYSPTCHRQHLSDGRSQVARRFERDIPWDIAFKFDDLDIPMSHWLSMLRVVDRREPAIGVDYDANRSMLSTSLPTTWKPVAARSTRLRRTRGRGDPRRSEDHGNALDPMYKSPVSAVELRVRAVQRATSRYA